MERNAALEFQVKQQAEKIKSFGLEQTINNQNKEELDLLRNENKMLKEKIEEFQETEQKLKQKIEEVKNDAKRENKQIICEGKLVIAAYIEQIEKAKEENEHLIREGKIEIDALIEQNEKANLETSTLLSKIEELNGQINSFQIKNQQLQTENTNLHRSVNYKEQVIIKQQQSVLQNKWVQSHYYKCCEKRCDMDLSKSSCVNKNSFIRIRENGDVKYYIGEGDGYRSDGFPLYPKYYYTKSDHVDLTVPKYFEITIRRETYGDYKGAYAVLYIEFGYEIVLTNDSSISIGNHENFSWRDGDVFGCGYTRPNKLFFTKNGSIIDNKEYVCYNDNELGNHYDLEPRIILFRCSIETNFGNNLLNKPFRYYSTQY